MDGFGYGDYLTGLDGLALVAVTVGVNLQPGQELIVTAGTDQLSLLRRIVDVAYAAGASLVTSLIHDEAIVASRFRHGTDRSFDASPGWLHDGVAKALGAGAARLAVVGGNPALLDGHDPLRVSRVTRANSEANKPVLDAIMGRHVNWSIVAAATPAWASAVFPGMKVDEAVGSLWRAIFAASRVDGPDPVAAWATHNADLGRRAKSLTAADYDALRFRGPGTDLVVGLADGHEWNGGAKAARNGVVHNANIPTEEVFTTPHSARVDGRVRSTKPLSWAGTLIEGIDVSFEAGRVVEARAYAGGKALDRLLRTDEGAGRLGEVALVPHSSPISRSGLVFRNTLYDENAACHLAFGRSYPCFADATNLSGDDMLARGGNRSAIHVDWMIGSGEVDVDGIRKDGGVDRLMSAGEWSS